MNWLTSRITLAVAATALLALTSCDKGTDLGVDLPDTTAISTSYLDLPLDVATVQLDSVETLKTDHFLVGRLRDNITGTTEARAYLNVLASPVSDSLPSKFTSPVLDSVVVVMGFDKVYGSGTTPARFDLYNLAQKLDDRQVYNGGSAPSVPPTEVLGTNLTSRLDRTQQITSTPTDGSAPVTTTVPDQTLRLRLDHNSTFSTRLFGALRTPGFTQARLEDVLKGLAVVPSASYNTGIVSFGRAYDSRMQVYFHAGADKRSYRIFFGPVNSSGGGSTASDPRYYTQLTSNLTGSPLAALADGTQAIKSDVLDNISYLQEGVGLGTRITFKNLEALRNRKGLAINRAELRVPVKPYTNGLFAYPAGIYALEVNSQNRILQRTVSFVPGDRVVQADGANQLGANYEAIGLLVSSSTTQPYYSLLITNYLQAYLNNKLDGELPASLVLVPNIRRSSTLTLNRATLDANNIRLFVYYSQL